MLNNGQIYRGNENPTQHLPWWLRKTTKNPQSGWSVPGFEPGTSRMLVSCVTKEPHRSVTCSLVSAFSQKNKNYKMGFGVCVFVKFYFLSPSQK